MSLPQPVIPLEADQKNYLQLAKELFIEALRIEPHCPYNNARCAKGLWSMPVPYKDKERAKEAILHAFTLAPHDSLVREIFIKLTLCAVFSQCLYGPLLKQILLTPSLVSCSGIYLTGVFALM
jgi:hypothetical protein